MSNDFVLSGTKLEKYTGAGGEVRIPEGVKTIGYRAFYACTSLTKVVIPTAVKCVEKEAFRGCTSLCDISVDSEEIEIDAFAGCVSLSRLELGDSVRAIGSRAFENAKALEFLRLPKGLRVMGDRVFGGCFALTHIEVDAANEVYLCQNNCVVAIKTKTLELACKGCVIPSDGSVKAIAKSAMWGQGVESVVIPKCVTKLGDSIFAGCSDLASLSVEAGNRKYESIDNCVIERISRTIVCACKNSVIPSDGSAVGIGGTAFWEIDGLKELVIPKCMKFIEPSDCPFWGCSGLERIEVAAGNRLYHSEGNCLIDTEKRAVLLGCKNSVIPADGSVKIIAPNAFAGNKAIERIVLPDSVIAVADDAFACCSSLREFVAGAHLKFIGNCAFDRDMALESVVLPPVMKRIGQCVFCESKIREFRIPEGIDYFHMDAFSACERLEKVVFPASLEGIAVDMMQESGVLTTLEIAEGNEKYTVDGNCLIDVDKRTLVLGTNTSVIPSDGSVTKIGRSAFTSRVGLKAIDIPSSVEEIDMDAFWNCGALKRMYIPDSVTTIGVEAFSNCTGLTYLRLPAHLEDVLSIGPTLNSLEELEISPDNPKYYSVNNCIIERDTRRMVMGCKGSVIPAGGEVETIASVAFDMNEGIEEAVVPEGVTCIEDGAFYYCPHLTKVVIADSVQDIDPEAFSESPMVTIYARRGSYAQAFAEQWHIPFAEIA